MKQYVKVRKVGDSVVLTVPAELVRKLRWKLGDRVLLEATVEGLWAEKDEADERAEG